MLLFSQILIVAAIAIIIYQLLSPPKEVSPLFKSLIPPKEQRPEEYLKSSRPKWSPLRIVALINRPLMPAAMRERLTADLSLARMNFSPEEFMLTQESLLALLIFLVVPIAEKRFLPLSVIGSVLAGFMLPRFWLSMKVSKVKREITKNLPDTIDLLNLCVNAGLDFMLALKWVVEKSQPGLLIDELRNLMQEINIGKSRRAALVSLSQKYLVPDMSSFTRTLIQADRMGTSVAAALEILSEDMRRRRFQRGEAQALKAPLKLLFPLLVFIFPVVGVIIAGPIFLQFMSSKGLMSGLGGG